MKKINIYTVIIIVLISVFKLNAQDRKIVWVHGLGEDYKTWEHYETIFDQEREMRGYRNSYNTSNGIDYATSRVISLNSTDLQSIAIGHSMGGLMIRNAERLSGNQRFGGIITVNTPNYGAPIANSISNGSLDGVVLAACEKLSAGPLKQGFSLPWNITSNLTNDVLCLLFQNIVVITNLVGSPETMEDLLVGSNIINDINSYPANTPTISIWSQEDSPVHWKLASSDDTDGANDTKIENLVNTARNIYQAHYTQNMAMGAATPWPFNLRYFDMAAQWKKGVNWLDNSETVWSELIKTTRVETHTYSYWDYQCIYTWDDRPELKQTAPPPDECEWEWVYVTKTEQVTISYSSDGLLPAYTQQIGDTYRVDHANHIEVTDMSNSPDGDLTKIEFNKIWNRTDIFHTEKRGL